MYHKLSMEFTVNLLDDPRIISLSCNEFDLQILEIFMEATQMLEAIKHFLSTIFTSQEILRTFASEYK
jgi:catabolite regulation protein CreA